MAWKLFLDDERDPESDDFVIARSFKEAVNKIIKQGCPSYVAFDFNLGSSGTGLDLAKWLVKRDIAENGKFLPINFDFSCHSSEPEFRDLINKVMSDYLASRKMSVKPDSLNISSKGGSMKTYPSVHLKAWLKSMRDLYEAKYEIPKDKVDYGVCICGTTELLGLLKTDKERMQFISGFFWSAWIDQVMFYILHRGVGELLNERNFYDVFHKTYNFQKIIAHGGCGGHASPGVLLTARPILDLFENGINKEMVNGDYKKAFWGEVKEWLASQGKTNIIEEAEKEFKKDQEGRFDQEWRIFF